VDKSKPKAPEPIAGQVTGAQLRAAAKPLGRIYGALDKPIEWWAIPKSSLHKRLIEVIAKVYGNKFGIVGVRIDDRMHSHWRDYNIVKQALTSAMAKTADTTLHKQIATLQDLGDPG
jgi:hypothetical protein